MLREMGEDVLQKEHLWQHRQNTSGFVDPLDKDADGRIEGGACQRDRIFVSQGKALRDGGHPPDLGFPIQVQEDIRMLDR